MNKIASLIRLEDNIVENNIIVLDDWINPYEDKFWFQINDEGDEPPVGAFWNGNNFEWEEPPMIPTEQKILENIDNPNIKDLVHKDTPDYDYIISLIDKALEERNK